MAIKKLHLSIISSVLVITCFLIIAAIKHHHKETQSIDPTPIVTLANLKTEIIPQTITSYGTTVSPASATIAAQTGGVVTHIAFTPGNSVKKGQLLFVLQSNDTGNQIQELKAAMMASKDIYDRSTHANQNFPGTIASETIEQEKLKYKQDLAAYKESQTAAYVVSPIDGIISDTNLTVGSSVSIGTVLAQVIDPQSLQIKYSLPSQYASVIQNGQHVLFYPNDSNQSYSGRVAYVSPLLNASDFTLTVRADLDHATLLKPYLFGKVVHIINPHYCALVIPQNLVQTDARGFYVYVINNNKVTKRYFTPAGVNKAGGIEVKDGLTAESKIIVSDYTSLSPSMIVKVKNV